MRKVVFALVVALGACLASPVYDLSFQCTSSGSPDTCPSGETCPTVPLGAGGCEDIPPLLTNAPIPLDAGRPEGCEAALPYGNPNFPSSQVVCLCPKLSPDRPVQRICPL